MDSLKKNEWKIMLIRSFAKQKKVYESESIPKKIILNFLIRES